MKISITLEVNVRKRDYPLFSRASSRTEMIAAIQKEHIIGDVIIPSFESSASKIIKTITKR